MAAAAPTPYDLLGTKVSCSDLDLRLAYRNRIQDLKSGKISSDRFRLVCRAYETLSDYEKRKDYNENQVWVAEVPLSKYTLQQLAAEPALASQLKSRLQHATLRQIDAQDPKTGHTPLYCAARACNVDAVYYLTEQGAEPDLSQKLGSSALHVSSFYGHPEIVRCLLESGADYRKLNSFGNLAEKEAMNNEVKSTFTTLQTDPFVQAAADQLDWFKENLDHMPNHIDEQYHRQRQTLLHCACKKGFTDLAQWLIDKRKANLDIVDINLNSALHLAAYGGHTSIVEYLLQRGASPLLINKWGMTAEQEGIPHGRTIFKSFQSMRNRDTLQMAADGVHWWFEYYFGDNSPNMTNSEGTSLLYIACRCGQTLVAKWLLDHGANVNIQLTSTSRSTPLHSAAYNGHLQIVELLLAHGADVNIKNHFGETVFDNARSDEIKRVLKQHRENLLEKKLLTVHLFGDGLSSGNEPLAKLQLYLDATRSDLRKAMPHALLMFSSFSVARRPLNFDKQDTMVISAFCRARYGKTKFVDFPLCMTVHEAPRYTKSGHTLSEEVVDYNSREFSSKFVSKCQSSTVNITGGLAEPQKLTCGHLLFTFPVTCAENDLSIDVEYINSPNFDTFMLPECLCLFKTRYHEKKKGELNELPNVEWTSGSNARLYSWIQSQPYWFADKAKQTHLPFIGGVHAFIRHVDVIPSALILPPDLFLQAATGEPISVRDSPVYCRCLRVREHNKSTFPHLAYHGTSIGVILSILMDGLVMPSTVVSNGQRVCPPPGHIARGLKAFDVEDFSNGIFVSPSIHYCSDPVYAVTFSDDDQRLVAVLECSVKSDSFGVFPGTVKGYTPHPTDDPKRLEWRLTNPAAVEITAVLFIPQIRSRIAAAKLRANKLGVDPNEL